LGFIFGESQRYTLTLTPSWENPTISNETKNLRITLVISSLGAGGAERVMCGICNYLAEQNYSITLITLSPAPRIHYKLVKTVQHKKVAFNWVPRNWCSRLTSQYVRLKHLRTEVLKSNPDLVISFTDKTNIRLLLSLWGTSIPVVVSERCDPTMVELSTVWRLLRRLLYPRADAVIAQTKTVAQWLGRFVDANRVFTIPNPIIAIPNVTAIERTNTVVAMGRLTSQKGFDLLIESWAHTQRPPGWRLVIAGEGPERQSLLNLAQRLGVSDSVILCGLLEAPEEMLQQASVFVLPSRYEGFPNVLLEAMANGVAVISFNCKSGPSEIITHEVDGILVPAGDLQALRKQLERLMTDVDLRRELGGRATGVLDRFSQSKVMTEWEHLIQEFSTT
jgi:glycosyltransferase involved in cell wall biosynthesis